ncbi:hypothetical protein A9Q84_20835 [Halobacteriovorax marinus]|uniref:Uncharacterized protein n=1 Tax=Halobacteriovorax marinus TaxID=97084 RepID=A0A1Y5F1G3_9BACT|nr:hypothetical protein A9Q84_20835 [Halobacteriovorax marinus]
MKIALVYLPFWPTYSPPLGLAYISSVLQRQGHEVKIFDKNIEFSKNIKCENIDPWSDNVLNKNSQRSFFNETTQPLLKKEILSFIKELVSEGYDAVGFSVTELSYYTTQYMSSLIKKLFPSILIMWGGPHVTAKNDLILADSEAGIFDVAFEAEAEETIQEFFNALKENKPYYSILGLICNHPENKKFIKKKRPSINYKELPFPDFRDYPLNLYKVKQLPIMMSRGCVATCSFCTEFLTWKSYRIRTAQDVVEEIKNHIENYQIDNFIFCDSLINGNHEQLEKLADGLENVACTWTAFCRVDERLTKNLLRKMFKAGCTELLIGFESDSQKVLDLMNKGTKIAQNQRVLEDAASIGIKVHGLFLVGFPGEEDHDFNKTLKFIHKNKDKFYVISIGNSLTLPPQSVVGMLPKKFNILIGENGEALLDNEGEWTSVDGSITPLIRKQRLNKLRNYLNSMKLNWVPQQYVERNSLQKLSLSIYHLFLKLFYTIKL